MKYIFTSLCLLLFVATTHAANATQVIKLNPFATTNLSNTPAAKGFCWTHSLSTARADAWRCMAGNSIFDPCFSSTQHPANVACIQSPEKNQMTWLQLTKPLPKIKAFHYNEKTAQPWVIKLTNNTTCKFMTGATGMINNMRINYGCTKPIYILGTIDKSKPLWTANAYDIKTKNSKTVAIKQAWF